MLQLDQRREGLPSRRHSRSNLFQPNVLRYRVRNDHESNLYVGPMIMPIMRRLRHRNVK